jgi:biopolymer transport protein ExbD
MRNYARFSVNAMAIKFGNRRGDYPAISDINVTPFVDVVLVLLVIFMVTAPTIMKDTLGIHLPKSSTGDGKKPVTFGVAVTRQGQILLNGEIVSDDILKSKVADEIEKSPDLQALVSADTDTRHGDVVHAIDLLKQSGLKKFALEIKKDEAK